MSRRRLARSGRPQAARERAGLPDALRDHRDPLWHDAEAVADLARAYRLTVTDPRYRSLAVTPWWARFDAFRRAWCEANGLMNPRYPQTLDYRRAAEAGIDMSASSRYRLAPNGGRNLPRD
jgi:hypothetical protein